MELTISFRVATTNAPDQPVIFVDASTQIINVFNETIASELRLKGVTIEPIDAQNLNLCRVRCIPIQIGKPYKDGKEFYKAAQAIKYYFNNRFNQNNYTLIQGLEQSTKIN